MYTTYCSARIGSTDLDRSGVCNTAVYHTYYVVGNKVVVQAHMRNATSLMMGAMTSAAPLHSVHCMLQEMKTRVDEPAYSTAVSGRYMKLMARLDDAVKV